MFDIYYEGNNDSVKEYFPFAKKIDQKEKYPPMTKMYWVIDANTEILDPEILKYRPDVYDQNYVHVWKDLSGNYGGLRLFPRKDVKGTKKIDNIACKRKVEVLRGYLQEKQLVESYFKDNSDAQWVWVADPDYVLPNIIEWLPDEDEPLFIHNFQMDGQLENKYPEAEGGLCLYHRNYKLHQVKYHGVLQHSTRYPLVYVDYDVFKVPHDDLTDTKVLTKLAKQSTTDWFWVVDDEVEYTGKLQYVPTVYDQGVIHVFKLKGHLEYRYPTEVVESWDKRCGPFRLVPKSFDTNKSKLVENRNPIQYDVFFAENPKEYDKFARLSRTISYWVVDNDYEVDPKLSYVPSPFDAENYTLNFKVPGQLDYRYPEKEGGMYLVNSANLGADVKYMNAMDTRYRRYPVVKVDDFKTLPEVSVDSWVIDKEYITDGQFEWAPKDFQKNACHVFHLRDQLRHKYPEDMGGVYWIPRNWNGEFVIHTKGDELENANKAYPVKLVIDTNITDVAEDCWIVDHDYYIDPIFDWVPPYFEQKDIHVFHVRDQLRHKYPERMGGIRWVPAEWSGDYVFHDYIDVPVKQNPVYLEEDTNITKVERDCWIVDNDYVIDPTFDWVPSIFERRSIHTFHVKDQLREKYPNEMGGIRWVPKSWDGNFVIHDNITTSTSKYPIEIVDYVLDKNKTYRDTWIVDEEYKIDYKFNWTVPDNQKQFIHTFHVPGQLTEKYYGAEGGIRWVPKNWNGEYIHHESIDVGSTDFNIVYTEEHSKFMDVDKPTWVVDPEYMLEPEFDWIPPYFERYAIHTFHFNNQLKHKYPDKMGGIRWVPPKWNGDYVFHSDIDLPIKQYPIVYTNNVDDYSQMNGKAGWLIDEDYIIDSEMKWCPSVFDLDMVHSFKIVDQLVHKYPEKMGGIRWVPENPEGAQVKIHDHFLPFEVEGFEVFTSIEEGDKLSTKSWFWVVDPEVKVLEGFNFGYKPEIWDAGKIHVWQKLNPVTMQPYDYEGVSLVPKSRKKGRPKYLREAACIQRNYHAVFMNGNRSVLEQLKEADEQCHTSMFYAVDPYTRVAEDFNFDYYPTQWDQKNVHVFQCSDGEFKHIRLYPKGTFTGEKEYTETELHNNSFENLKEINFIASLQPSWPVVNLVAMTKDELEYHLDRYAKEDVPFIFTVDKSVKEFDRVVSEGFLPETKNQNKVHVWQRMNVNNESIHSYGGLRLWPTNIDRSQVTTAAIRVNKIKNVQYVRKPGCIYKPYDVAFLSYHEPNANEMYDRLLKVAPHAKWIKNVDGIFEAHQAAANACDTDMFWVVDADALVHLDFDFGYVPDQYDQDVVHVWNSENPVTGAIYGYGGIKLFNRMQVVDASSWGLDFTTGLSSRFKVMNEVACITNFNTDEYSTWRSAFRECVKLVNSTDSDAEARLNAWLDPIPAAKFADYAKKGAEMGKAYGERHKGKPMRLARINDYEWLRETFDEEFTKS